MRFFRARRDRLALLSIVAVALLLSSPAAVAFMQNGPLTPDGHEFITLLGGNRAGAPTNEPQENEITGPRAACRTCDQHGTKNWRLWSAIMGQRWADTGGYSAVWGKIPGQNNCFIEVSQDSDFAQYTHALRRKHETDADGNKCANVGMRQRMLKTFLRAVHTPDSETIWFTDGGATTLSFKANKAYFMLGLAIHALEDSFSGEHTERTQDLMKIKTHKTYVGTPNVPEHRHDFGGANIPSKFDKSHGDNPFTNGEKAEPNLKPTAAKAVEATKEFFEAFKQARDRNNKTDTAAIFRAFALKWLDLETANDATVQQCRQTARQANPGGTGRDSWVHSTEQDACLDQNPALDDIMEKEYPAYCRTNCSDGNVGKAVDSTKLAGCLSACCVASPLQCMRGEGRDFTPCVQACHN
jgi:hypothetical protein